MFMVGGAAARPAPELLIENPPELEAVADEVRAIGRGNFSGALMMTGLMGFAHAGRAGG